MNDDVTKSWFAVLNNPEDHGYRGTPQEICEQMRDEWIGNSKTRSGIWAFCVSSNGLPHVHMVLEDTKAMRFSIVKNTYACGAHFEKTKGTKEQAEDYIYKRGSHEEKGEETICVVRHGKIHGRRGHRSDLDEIQALLDQGCTPEEIMAANFKFCRYQKMIKTFFSLKTKHEIPPIREVTVHYLVGESGSGKSYHFKKLCDEYGESNICMVTDYENSGNGGFDHYAGEKILFMDEFKGEISFGKLLTLLDKTKAQIHARYSNVWAAWSDVYITTVYPPEKLYVIMVPSERQDIDSFEQLRRRINDVTYCYVENGTYKTFTIPMNKYKSYEMLKMAAALHERAITGA